ncbi:hypothetical protein CYMTET_40594 [Cymbomonas tetramitiformis]|uniref:Protein nlrc3 n=1 Tax=Cymbomonas tetramitiformis TaxID=36881 RepID=A0AAE0C7N5_9CHLO|nr:hypothetical protein CYMTET_40594 [Cymbomonas tetramitiformis]
MGTIVQSTGKTGVQLVPAKGFELCPQFKEVMRALFSDCTHVEYQRLHGGFSGSLVLLARGKLASGYSEDPCVVKLDRADDIRREVELSKEAKAVLEDYAPAIQYGPEYVGEGEAGYGGICLELAGACWVMPEFVDLEAKLVTTLKDVYLQSVESLDGPELNRRDPAEVLYELFGVTGILHRFTEDAAPLEGDIFSVHKLREELHAAVLCEKRHERSFFHRHPEERDPLLPVCEQLYRTLGAPLSSCWAQWRPLGGRVHGDLNGANVLIDIRGTVWLIDFAKLGKGHVLKDIAKVMCCLWLEYTRVPLGVKDGREAANSAELGLWLGCDTDGVEEVWEACCASQGTSVVCPSVQKLTEGRPGSHRWCGSEKERQQAVAALEALTEAFFGEEAPLSLHDEPLPLQATGLGPAPFRRSIQSVHALTCELWKYAGALVSATGKGEELDAHAMALWVPLLCEALKLLKYRDCSPQQKIWAAHLAKRLAERVAGKLGVDREVACMEAAGKRKSEKLECCIRLQTGARGWLDGTPAVVLAGWDSASGKHTLTLGEQEQSLDLDEAMMDGELKLDARFTCNPIPSAVPEKLLEVDEFRVTVQRAQAHHIVHREAVDGLYVVLDAHVDDLDARREGGEERATWDLSVKVDDRWVAEVGRTIELTEALQKSATHGAWRIKSCQGGTVIEDPESQKWSLFVPVMHCGANARWVLRNSAQGKEKQLRARCVAVMYSRGQRVWVLERSASEAEAATSATLWREGVVAGLASQGGASHYEMRFGKELRSVELKPGNHCVAPSVLYDVGTALVVCLADGIWKDAKVIARQGEEELTTLQISDGSRQQVYLNSFNHALEILPMSHFERSWKWYMAKVVQEHSAIVDVLSGQRLDVREHLVRITVVTRAIHRGDLKWEDELQEGASVETNLEGEEAEEEGEDGTCFNVACIFSSSPMRHMGEHSPHCYILIAGAAMGKTTLMRRIMVDCAEDRQAEFVPILVLALDWARKLREGLVTGDNPNLLLAYLRVLHGDRSRKFLLLQQALAMRRALILVDGMDEAGERMPILAHYLVSQLAKEGHRLVITSRPGGVSQQQVLLLGDTFLQLQPLSIKQQKEMVQCRIRRKRKKCGDDFDTVEDTSRFHNFWDALLEHRDISSNPLMLSMLISVYKHGGGRFPATAVEIYQMAIQAMVVHVERKNRSRRSGDEKSASLWVLTLLAYHQQTRRKRDITPGSVTEAFRVLNATEADEEIWKLLQARCVEGRMALLPCVSQGDGRGRGWELRFAHLTFQEYLCSNYLVGILQGVTGAKGAPSPTINELLGQPWWDKTMQFCEQQVGPQTFYDDLLALHEADALRMEDPQEVKWGVSHLIPQLLRHSGKLRSLHLIGNNIGPEGAKALAVALTPNAEGVFNTSLNTLTLTKGADLPVGGLRRNELTELDLRSKGLGDEDAIVLGALLVSNNSLNTLRLIGNRIGPEGAKALAVALTPNAEGVFNTSLNTLSLYDNDITDEGAKALAVALTPDAEGVFNTSLNTLDLYQNQIGPEGAKALAAALTPNEKGVVNTFLNALNVGDNKIGPEGAKALAVALTPNEEGVFNTSLNRLNLYRNDIGPEGAKALAIALTPNEKGVFNTSLNTLYLGGNKIGSEGAKALAVALTPNAEGVFNTSLNTLYLRNNKIGCEGAKALAVALTPNVEGVFNTSLNTLNLRVNQIGPEGAKALAVALTPNEEGVFNTSLNTLNLCRNGIGPEGAKALAIALTPNEKGVFNTSLNTLDLSCNQLCGVDGRGRGTNFLRDDGRAAILAAMEQSDTLTSVCGIPPNTTEFNLAFQHLGPARMGPEDAKLLAGDLVFNGSLNTLNVWGNAVQFEEGNAVQLEGARALANAVKQRNAPIKLCGSLLDVKELDLSREHGVMVPYGDNGVKPEDALLLANDLMFNTSLNTLYLGGNQIGPEGAKALAAALTPNEKGVFNTSLNTLNLAVKQRNAPIKLCGSLLDVKELDLSREHGVMVPYGDNGVKPEDALLLANDLMFNTSLNTLYLGDNRIGPEGAKALAVALIQNEKGVFNTSLNTLTLTKGADLPVGGLRRNELTELDLGDGSEGLGDEDAIVLGALLVSNNSVNTLLLNGNRIGPEGAKALAVALTPNAEGVFNTSLNTLDLAANRLCGMDNYGHGTYDASGIKALAEALVFNTSLNTLNVGDNKIGPEGAKALAVALTPNAEGVFNTSLNTLNVGGNFIGPEGAKALAVALTPNAEGVFNRSLNTLHLAANSIGTEGAKALAVALTPNAEGVFNTSLNTLDLCNNGITGDAAQQLAEAVLKHPCIIEFNKIMMQDIKDDKVTELHLSDKLIEVPGALVLSKLLMFNTSLNTLDLSSQFELPFGALRRNEITELDLSGKRLGPEGSIILGAVLAFNTSLNTLDLTYNRIGPEGAKALAVALIQNEKGVFNGSLNTLTLTKGADLPVGGLRRNELTELHLGDESLGDEDAIVLGALLVSNNSVNTLNLIDNRIGPKGAKALAVALTPNAEGVFNTSLNTLHLAGNFIGPEAAKALAVALTPNAEGVFNTSLNTLDLGCNDIGDEGAKALAIALTPNAEGVFNTSLKTLHLYGNRIGDEGAKALAVALTPNAEGVFNTSLNTLNLECNEIGSEGAKALAVALTPNAEGVFNTSLNTLDLERNRIGDEGAKALAIALTPNAEGVFNTSLNTLSLEDNKIGPEAAKALAVALTPNEHGVFNTCLNTLRLGYNEVGYEGKAAVQEATRKHPNAATFTLHI